MSQTGNPFIDHLITRGHARQEDSPFYEPVTVNGRYKAHNGFWYRVCLNNGKLWVSDIGYSAEYCQAERAVLEYIDPYEAPQRAEREILKRRGCAVQA